jgi:choline kinase
MGEAGSRRRDVAVIVLAAGHGRRLGPAGGPGPKWLIEVAGQPIAERQLQAVEQALGPATEVLVVVGHAAERVERFVRGREGRSDLRPTLVHNPHHADRNNWYSLLVGLDALDGRFDDGVVVVVNSDLFAPPGWIGAFLAEAADLGEVPGTLAVDVERPLTDEAMKVAAGTAGGDGRRRCTAIGKVAVADPVGEYVGMTALGPVGRARVHQGLRRFEGDPARADAWYEGAFQELSAEEPFLSVWPTPSSGWVEIDDGDDLLAATRLGPG